MLYQMAIRPDDIYRTGVIQPFNVVSQSPVTYAREEVAPWIEAVRPEGSLIQEGNLGLVSPEVLRTLSGFGHFGQEDVTTKWYFAAAALAVGLAAGVVVGKWAF